MELDPQENQGRSAKQMEDNYKILDITIKLAIIVAISLLIIGV